MSGRPFLHRAAICAAVFVGCRLDRSVERHPVRIRRLTQETALAERLDVDRSALRPQRVELRGADLRWITPDPTAPNQRFVDLPVRRGVAYRVAAEFSALVDGARVVYPDAFRRLVFESMRPSSGSSGRRVDASIPAAMQDSIRIEYGAPVGVDPTIVTLEEATTWSHSQLLNQRDRDLRAVVSFATDARRSHLRSIDALRATGASLYTWDVSPGFANVEGTLVWSPRAAGVASALLAGVEVHRAGRWERVFSTTMRESESAPRSFRVPIGDADGVRFVTAPVPGSRPGTVAWGSPVLVPTDSPSLPDIVIVSIDACRADVLGAYGSQLGVSGNIDEASRLGVVFEQARAQRTQTWTSLTSMHAGSPSESVGVMRRGDSSYRGYAYLADRLNSLGYFSVQLGNITMPHGHFGRFDSEVETPRDVSAAGLVVEHLRAHTDRPVFAWVHLAATHYPWNPPAPFRPSDVAPDDPLSTREGFFEGVRNSSATNRDKLNRLYLATIRETDHALDALFSELFRPGRRGGPGIVAIVADHGSQAGEDGVWFMHSTASRNVVQIPMILAAPGRLPRGRRVSRLVRLIDLAPTMLDLVGGNVDGMEGRSLRALIDGRPDAPRVSITRLPESGVHLVETDMYRLRLNENLNAIVWPELPGLRVVYPMLGLYRWRDDLEERRNLAGAEPLVVGEMYRLLIAPRSIIGRSISGSARRLLEQAGYAEEHED